MDFNKLKRYEKGNAIAAFKHYTGLDLSIEQIFLYCSENSIKFKKQGSVVVNIDKILKDFP